MRIIFMGTPDLSATVLRELVAHHEIIAVFTRPDAVRGRGKKLVPSPVKLAANELGIEVHEAAQLHDGEIQQFIKSLKPDVICVAAYGCILPKVVLDIPRFGCLNVHTSLLPRWRGAAPIERAILAGDKETGVCIMRMEEGLDTGAYCIKRAIEIKRQNARELTAELAALGADALIEALDALETDRLHWTEQPDDGLSYAEKIEKSEFDFGPEESAASIDAKVRASSESHPAKLTIADRRIAVLQANVVDNIQVDAGLAALIAKKLYIGTSNGALELQQVKPDGKNAMEGRAFAAGIQGIKNTPVKWGRA